MPRPPRLNTQDSRCKIRSLFLLYEKYKTLTRLHIKDQDSTTVEINATYRNKLVPEIREIVSLLQIEPESRRSQSKLTYEPLPFTDLDSVHDVIRLSEYSADEIMAMIGRVQSNTKDLLVNNKAADAEIPDNVQMIIERIDSLYGTSENSASAVPLAKKPYIECTNGKWFIKGSKKTVFLSERGSRNGELLYVLLHPWGVERSYESLFEAVNARTKKKHWDQSHLPNAIKAINQRLRKAGYRGLKLYYHGTSVNVGSSEK